MKRLVGLTAILLLSVASAAAFTVRGIGGSSCRDWNNGKDWNVKVQWMLGFISGAEAIMRPGITDGTSSVNNDLVIQAITSYCREHPSADIDEAGLAAIAIMNPR